MRSETGRDGIDALLITAGALLGLILLMLYAQTIDMDVSQQISPLGESVVPWQYANIRPEPWEKHLFHIGTFLTIGSALVFWLMSRRWIVTGKWACAVAGTFLATFILLAIFLPVAEGRVLPAPLPLTAAWQALIPHSLPFLLAVGIAMIGIVFSRRLSLPAMNERLSLILEIILVGLGITWLSFDPLLLIPFQAKSAGDSDWFFMPAFDILHGKHLLIASESQYGLLLFYGIAAVLRFIGTTLSQFGWILMGAHAFYYACLYGSVRLLFPKRSHAILTFLFILGYTLLRNESRSDMYGEPSITRLRNLLDAPVLLLMCLEYRVGGWKWFTGAAIFTGIAAFTNLDTGIAITLMMLVWAVAKPLWERESLPSFVQHAAIRCAIVFGCIALTGGIITIELHAATGIMPDWNLYTSAVQLYLAGFGAMPMPFFGAYWFVLFGYAAASLVALHSLFTGRRLMIAPLLLALSADGLLAFHYYTNRSFIANLWVIAQPAALCLALLAAEYWNRCHSSQNDDALCAPKIMQPMLWIGAFFLSLALVTDVTTLWTMVQRRYINPPTISFDADFAAALDTSAQVIKEHILEGQRVAVLSPRESVFNRASDRSSVFAQPFLESILTIPRFQTVLERFVDENHPYLFVESHYDRCPSCDVAREALLPFYTFQGTGGLLDVYVRNTPRT